MQHSAYTHLYNNKAYDREQIEIDTGRLEDTARQTDTQQSRFTLVELLITKSSTPSHNHYVVEESNHLLRCAAWQYLLRLKGLVKAVFVCNETLKIDPIMKV